MKTTLLALAIHFPASLECSWSAVLHPASRDATLWVAHSARHSAVGIAPIAWSMGCCGSKAADVDERDNGADAASKELDRQMAEQQKEEAQVTKRPRLCSNYATVGLVLRFSLHTRTAA